MRKIVLVLCFLLAAVSARAADNDTKPVSAGVKSGLELIDKGDIKGAVEAFNKSCDGGDGFGCSIMGFIVMIGDEQTPGDPIKAATAYEKGCNLKDESGCLYLAGMYMDGTGVTKDSKKMASYLEKACNYGAPEGCFTLGSLYMSGEQQVKKDEKKGKEYLKKACDMGMQTACETDGAKKVK